MYTQCPACLTVFRLAVRDLAAAGGHVRCGRCAEPFDAVANLADELPPKPFEQLVSTPPSGIPPQLLLPVYRPNLAQGLLFPLRERTAPASPAFASAPPARPRRLSWALGCLLLCLGLAVQVAWAERARWMDAASIRDRLDPVCTWLHCPLPPRHDPAQLALGARDIHPHPSVPGALVISATLRNDAPFAQPFPTLKITLSNLDGQRVAMRRFRPEEYVGDAGSLERGLASDDSLALSFEVVDPGNDAVAFEFDFE